MTVFRPLAALRHEARLTWMFVWRDLSTTLIPMALFMAGVVRHRWPASAWEVACVVGRWALYFWLYIYLFTLANQCAGVEEDRRNKPDRPIPSGAVSYRGAVARLVIVAVALCAAGWWFGVFKWAVAWAAVCAFLCFLGGDKHWFTKNAVGMFLATAVELAAAWELVTPLTPLGWRWVLTLAATIGLTANIQDFRDVAGDRLVGRRTLPMAFGQGLARAAQSAVLIAIFVADGFVLFGAAPPWKQIACGAGLAGFGVAIVLRLNLLRTPAADHKTYMLYTYSYCYLLGTSMLVM